MLLKDNLRSRWRDAWNDRADMASMRSIFENTLSLFGAPKNKKAELGKPGTLSEKGINEAFRDHVTVSIVPMLRDSRASVQKYAASIAAEKLSIRRPPAVDRSDVVGFLLRQELRSYLRDLDPGPRLAAVMGSDDRFMSAVLEAPEGLSGLSPEQRTAIEDVYVERTHGARIAALNEKAEMVELVDAAIGSAIMEVKRESGLDDRHANVWFELPRKTENNGTSQ